MMFIEEYIENKELALSSYIRDGMKAKAILIDNSSSIITLQYKAGITASKKKIILDNL